MECNNLIELSLSQDRGYFQITLKKENRKVTKRIHRLVAEHYIENPYNLPQVNHIDENKTNNHVSNLEWVSHHQNQIHSKCRWIWRIENIKTGDIIETTNICEFSKNNNLHNTLLYKTLTGERKQHKNFRIVSKTQFK